MPQEDFINHNIFVFLQVLFVVSPPLSAFLGMLVGGVDYRKRVALQDCDPLLFSPSNWSIGGPFELINIKSF